MRFNLSIMIKKQHWISPLWQGYKLVPPFKLSSVPSTFSVSRPIPLLMSRKKTNANIFRTYHNYPYWYGACNICNGQEDLAMYCVCTPVCQLYIYIYIYIYILYILSPSYLHEMLSNGEALHEYPFHSMNRVRVQWLNWDDCCLQLWYPCTKCTLQIHAWVLHTHDWMKYS